MMLDYTIHTCPRCKLFKYSRRNLDIDVNADGEITGTVTLEASSLAEALGKYYCKYRWWNCPLEAFNEMPVCKHYRPKY